MCARDAEDARQVGALEVPAQQVRQGPVEPLSVRLIGGVLPGEVQLDAVPAVHGGADAEAVIGEGVDALRQEHGLVLGQLLGCGLVQGVLVKAAGEPWVIGEVHVHPHEAGGFAVLGLPARLVLAQRDAEVHVLACWGAVGREEFGVTFEHGPGHPVLGAALEVAEFHPALRGDTRVQAGEEFQG